MAKRKFGASIIILCIAAVTLISGTYAWFLVGGFAELFNIGFDVIESTGGLLLQGDGGTAVGGTTDWGTSLDRKDFQTLSFIAEGGAYRPVSTADSNIFILVEMREDSFVSSIAPGKGNTTEPTQICYNDFSFKIKSDADEIVASEGKGAYVTIDLTGEKEDKNSGELTNTDNGDISAVNAARVAVTFDGTTRFYSIDGEDYRALSTIFTDQVVDNNDNRIIDAGDTNMPTNMVTPSNYSALKDSNGLVKIYLGNIPASTTNGKEVAVKIWLEGNDKDCVDFAERTIAGKSLMSKINFGVDE